MKALLAVACCAALILFGCVGLGARAPAYPSTERVDCTDMECFANALVLGCKHAYLEMPGTGDFFADSLKIEALNYGDYCQTEAGWYHQGRLTETIVRKLRMPPQSCGDFTMFFAADDSCVHIQTK